MEKELKAGCYCQWCYQQLVDSAVSQGKGVTPGRSEDSGLDELCGCGKKAVVEAISFYDVERVIQKFCAYDKDRVCDESCVAFVKGRETLFSELHFDRSNVIPQFDWARTLVIKGNWCARLKDTLGDFEIIKSIKDGEVVDLRS